MTHIDPRDPRRADIDPLMPENRRLDTEPALDPRLDRAAGSNWAVVGGLAVALVLVIAMMSMFGSSSDPTSAQRPPVAQGTPGPTTDPATTGSVPRREPAAPMERTPAQPAPQPAPANPTQQ